MPHTHEYKLYQHIYEVTRLSMNDVQVHIVQNKRYAGSLNHNHVRITFWSDSRHLFSTASYPSIFQPLKQL